MKPARYSDGRDRVAVRVEHRLTRDEVVNALARHAEALVCDFQEPITVAELRAGLRDQLGHHGSESLMDPVEDAEAQDWAERHAARLWPERA